MKPMKKTTAVTPAMAGLILELHFKTKPTNLRRIHGGLVNDVFEARIKREELVLRISQAPGKLQAFMKEQWAVAAALKKKIPTPEILEVSSGENGLSYMISRKVAGHPAIVLGSKRLEVLRELGEYTARINAIPTQDFGHIFDWSPNKLSRQRTWQAYLDNELKVNERIATFRESGVLNAGQLKKLRNELQSMRSWNISPTLSHGDIRLKNVIVGETGKIIAILDWENCTSNVAPYWELSLALHDLTMDEKQKFLEGYGLDLKEFMRIAPAIKALNVLNYARSVRHALKRRDQQRLLGLRARLSGAFDLYSL
jgi:aminoglycoside phosphotransferase (APT) family kinase protein